MGQAETVIKQQEGAAAVSALPPSPLSVPLSLKVSVRVSVKLGFPLIQLGNSPD